MLGADSSVSQSIALQNSQVDKLHVISDAFPNDSTKLRHSKQTIVAAAAGDNADTDRMIGILKTQATIREYETSVGSDVEYICIGSISEEERDSSFQAKNNDGLSVEAVARLARALIASSLRSQSPFQTCLLVAGMQHVNRDNRNDDNEATMPFSSHLQQQVQRASREFQQESSQADSKSNVQEESNNDNEPNNESTLRPRLYWLDSYGALQQLQYGAHGLGANFLLSILDQGFHPNMTRNEALLLIQECFRQLQMRYIINSPQPPRIKCVDAHGCHVMNTCKS